MTTYARILNGTVAELAVLPAGAVLSEYYDPRTEWVECDTPGVTQGWMYGAGIFAALPPPPPPTAAQQATAMLATGCAIVSTGTPSLNGSYALDAESRADVQAEIISILVNGTFTNGTALILWPDTTGAPHAFTIAGFKALATALGGFVGTCKVIASTNTGALPAQPSAIP